MITVDLERPRRRAYSFNVITVHWAFDRDGMVLSIVLLGFGITIEAGH